jgi:hypothetical protein
VLVLSSLPNKEKKSFIRKEKKRRPPKESKDEDIVHAFRKLREKS